MLGFTFVKNGLARIRESRVEIHGLPLPSFQSLADKLQVLGEAQVVRAQRSVVLAGAAPEAHHRHAEPLSLVPTTSCHAMLSRVMSCHVMR